MTSRIIQTVQKSDNEPDPIKIAKFKVGDKVEIDVTHDTLVGTIKSVGFRGKTFVYIVEDYYDHTEWTWEESQLELWRE